MNTELATIKVTKYTDSKGNPTCAKDFPTGKVCIFYATYRFGANEFCFLTQKNIFRRDKGEGSLIPTKECPVHE